MRYSLVGGAAAILLVMGAAKLPRTIDVVHFLQEFVALETRTQAKYEAAIESFRSQIGISANLARRLDEQVFAEWMTAQHELARARRLPAPEMRTTVAGVARYMELRHDAWVTTAAVILDGKSDRLKEATEKQRQADELMKELLR